MGRIMTRHRYCDGITRREVMRVGALSLFGSMSVPRLLQAAGAPSSRQCRARSVILFNLLADVIYAWLDPRIRLD